MLLIWIVRAAVTALLGWMLTQLVFHWAATDFSNIAAVCVALAVLASLWWKRLYNNRAYPAALLCLAPAIYLVSSLLRGEHRVWAYGALVAFSIFVLLVMVRARRGAQGVQPSPRR